MERYVYVNLGTIDRMENFFHDVCGFQEEINIYYTDDKCYDAKSIMGIFALNMLEPKKVEIVTDDEGVIVKFMELMKKYKVEDV